jgi:D-glycero-D-manno-heptose 1,7-bisphosphate phosphatase
MEKVVFLDRDGVISKDSPDHIKSWDEFFFLPNAKAGIKLLTDHDFKIIVITNQSVIARGMTTVEELEDMHKKMIHEIEIYGGEISDIYYCPHHPNDGCKCRKPEPGMLLKAIKDHDIDPTRSFMVGDRMMDVNVGKKVGCRTVIIPSDVGLKELQKSDSKPDYIANDLLDAGGWIIENY